VIKWEMRKLRVEEWLISAVMSIQRCKNSWNSNCFQVKTGMYQGSALSRLHFVTVMEALSREFRVASPWELVYADDL